MKSVHAPGLEFTALGLEVQRVKGVMAMVYGVGF